MKKFLLIDDLALRGWKSVIEKSVIKSSGILDIATSFYEAINKTKDKYDLIFLDVRLIEEDHNPKNVIEYSGFKILKEIKKDFLKVNFSTPIILITASNKIWILDAFRDYGVDSFYIKEHPDNIFSKENSLNNLKRLQNDFLSLKEIGSKRREIWDLCSNTIELINNHAYFNVLDSKYLNIKNRIIDKIKLGYSHLFKKQSKIEKEMLLSNNESLSFIIFWSILEEISKGFTDISETWDNVFNRNGNWKYRNREYFIEYIVKQDLYKINYDSKTGLKDILIKDDKNKYHNGIINLSDQILSLIHAYAKKDKINSTIQSFKEINKYRNEVDFIHSSVNNILNKSIVNKVDIEKAYNMNIKILKLINEILSIKVR
jgi:CheY-like chemotaxis protein